MPRAKVPNHGPNANQRRAAYLAADGHGDDYILLRCFPLTEDENQKRKNKRTLNKWKREPWFQEQYDMHLKNWYYSVYGKAIHCVSEQLEDKNPWIVNKAANDMLNHAGKVLYGGEKSELVVKIEGSLPDLGMPSAEEQE